MLTFNENQFEQKVQTIFFDCFRIVFKDYFPNGLIQPTPEPNEFVTKRKAAEICDCAESTVDNWRRAGKIKRYNVGSSVRFKRSELLSLLEGKKPT